MGKRCKQQQQQKAKFNKMHKGIFDKDALRVRERERERENNLPQSEQMKF